MDRIELDEQIDSEQYEKKQFKPLDLPSVARFKVKPASNINHERNKALAGEINKLWGIPIPRLMIEIKRKGYQFIQETFTQVQKNPNARNPAALFLWTISRCKVELKEVELK